MFVIRRYNILYRMTLTSSYCASNAICLIPNVSKDHMTGFIQRVRMPRYNVKNIRSLSDSTITSSTEDFQTKVMLLNKNMNNNNVNINLMTSIIESLENNQYDVSQTLSLMLLSCCGNMMYKESANTRQELLNRVLNILKERKCKLTLKHYHALLNAYIDNDHAINPHEFLKTMSVLPEYNTYCLLLEVPSLDNYTFTDTVMSKIAENTLYIGRKICNALMYAYAVAGNVDGVRAVAKLMEAENISSHYDIYLMYAYARNGNIDELMASLKDISLPPLHLMQLVKNLSLSGHGVYIRNILEHGESLTTDKHAIPIVIQLVHSGLVLDAYNVVTHIPDDTESHSIKRSLALCLVREIIKKDESTVTILEILTNLVKDVNTADILEKAINMAVEENKESLALVILDKMKAMDIAMEPRYFWSLLLHAQKEDSKSDLYTILRHMVALGVDVDSQTLIKYVFPFIGDSDPITVVMKLAKCGINPVHTVEPYVQYLLNAGRMVESIKLCTLFKKKIDCQKVLDPLFVSYMKSNRINSCIQFMYELCYNGHGFVGTFIKKLINLPDYTEGKKEDLIRFISATKYHKAAISIADALYIEKKLSSIDFKADEKNLVLQLVRDIRSDSTKQYSVDNLHVKPEYMNMDQLHAHFKELKDKNKNARGVLRKLLMKSCSTNNAELVQKLVSEFNDNEYHWTPGMKLKLFDFYVKLNMTENALSELQWVQDRFPTFGIDNFKILRLITLLVEKGQIDEAIKMLKSSITVNQIPNAYVQVHNLLDLVVKKGYSDYLEEMMELLVKRQYCRHMTWLFRHLILMHISKGNMEGAVNVFASCIKSYNKTPAKQEILIELAKLSSHSNPTVYDCLLESVYELIIKVHDEDTANVNLVIAFAACNKITELRRILQTTHVRERPLLKQLHFLKDEEIVTATLAMLEASGDGVHVDFGQIYKLALSIYDKQGNCEGAVQLKETMESKNIEPSASFVDMFNTLLRIHKIPSSVAVQ